MIDTIETESKNSKKATGFNEEKKLVDELKKLPPNKVVKVFSTMNSERPNIKNLNVIGGGDGAKALVNAIMAKQSENPCSSLYDGIVGKFGVLKSSDPIIQDTAEYTEINQKADAALSMLRGIMDSTSQPCTESAFNIAAEGNLDELGGSTINDFISGKSSIIKTLKAKLESCKAKQSELEGNADIKFYKKVAGWMINADKMVKLNSDLSTNLTAIDEFITNGCNKDNFQTFNTTTIDSLLSKAKEIVDNECVEVRNKINSKVEEYENFFDGSGNDSLKGILDISQSTIEQLHQSEQSKYPLPDLSDLRNKKEDSIKKLPQNDCNKILELDNSYYQKLENSVHNGIAGVKQQIESAVPQTLSEYIKITGYINELTKDNATANLERVKIYYDTPNAMNKDDVLEKFFKKLDDDIFPTPGKIDFTKDQNIEKKYQPFLVKNNNYNARIKEISIENTDTQKDNYYVNYIKNYETAVKKTDTIKEKLCAAVKNYDPLTDGKKKQTRERFIDLKDKIRDGNYVTYNGAKIPISMKRKLLNDNNEYFAVDGEKEGNDLTALYTNWIDNLMSDYNAGVTTAGKIGLNLTNCDSRVIFKAYNDQSVIQCINDNYENINGIGKVVIKTRPTTNKGDDVPIIKKSTDSDESDCVEIEDNIQVTTGCNDLVGKFGKFTGVFINKKNDQVYNGELGNGNIEGVISNMMNVKFNTTFLSYGLSGSGKTYTLIGNQWQSESPDSSTEKGISQLLLDTIKNQYTGDDSKIEIKLTSIQLYQGDILRAYAPDDTWTYKYVYEKNDDEDDRTEVKGGEEFAKIYDDAKI